MMSIEDEVLVKIEPMDDENSHIQEVVSKIKSKVLDVAQSMKLKVEPVLVGSVAKGTHLNDPDIDIFVMFPSETKRRDLESHGLKIGMEVLGEYEKRYAEHPYVSGMADGPLVEIVPCYKINDPSERMSAVDRTPFHTYYIIEHLKEEQKNEVRLLKRFLKGIGIYGAEAEIEGFSGYLCELLILYYGSFKDLISNVKNWTKGELIAFNKRKLVEFTDSLIVIDPVDPGRNVASALSHENFAIFIHAAREYEKEPTMKFFFPNEVKPEQVSNLKDIMAYRETTLLGITFEKPDVLSDILHSQLRKAQKTVVKLFKRYDFNLIAFDFYVNDNIVMLFEFDVYELSQAKLHNGPPVWHENSTDFKSKWIGSADLLKGPYIKDGHWYVDIKREFTNAKSLLAENLMSMNLGSYVTESLKKGYELLKDDEMLKEDFARSLTRFYFKKFPWEY
jgi:tRNA nucleotidyltransferase (CCA-adding enzyme)